MLDRTKFEGTVSHPDEATPSAEALRKLLSKKLDAEEENVEIDKIFTLRGRQKSKFWAKGSGSLQEEVKEEFTCEECGKKFDSKRGLSIHKSQAHKEEKEDYGEVLSGTISEAKEKIEEMEGPDFEKLLQLEKENKDRKGMKKFLKKNLED